MRLVVPGFYGTNSVKWLTRLTLAANRVESRGPDAFVDPVDVVHEHAEPAELLRS